MMPQSLELIDHIIRDCEFERKIIDCDGLEIPKLIIWLVCMNSVTYVQNIIVAY